MPDHSAADCIDAGSLQAFEPNPMLQEMIRRGDDGLSTGRGFYDWSGCDRELVRKLASARLAPLLEFLDHGMEPPPQVARPKPGSR